MSGPFGSSQWMYASGGFYNGVATQSLRFNDDDTAYLSRTPSSASNQKTWTYSTWFKIANTNTYHTILSAGVTGTPRIALYMTSDGQLITDVAGIGSYDESVARFRDASAWYHLVWAFDTTQATGSNRSRMYINGTEITLTKTRTWSLDTNYAVNGNVLHTIGTFSNSIGSFNSDKYQAETNFVDGSQLNPTSFGETKNGVWIPKEYTGSYGTNGFRLQFNQTGTGTASSSTIGSDTSGNDNHWTSSGIVASDCDMPDSPELNWCTLNPLQQFGSGGAFAEGNLQYENTSTGSASSVQATMGVSSGKWYFETVITSASSEYIVIGWDKEEDLSTQGAGTDNSNPVGTGWSLFQSAILVQNAQVQTGVGTATQNDIVGCTIDLDSATRQVKWYKNNSLIATQNILSTGYTHMLPMVSDLSFIGTPQMVLNFGQDSSFAGNKTAQGNTDGNGIGDFYYSPPSGYLALCTANLPEPTISPAQTTQADDYFNTVLYTGTGSTQSITGVGFQPDWIWQKERSNNTSGGNFHYLSDSVRGVNAILQSNTTGAESTGTDVGINSFDSDGFTMGSYGGGNANQSGETYVSWNWKAGGTASSYTPTGATASVSMTRNSTAGFSIVTYTGTGTANDVGDQALGHGLQVNDVDTKPDMMIIKARDAGDYSGTWKVWHKDMGGTLTTDFLTLNTTSATASTSDKVWDGAEPTSTLFSVGYDWDVNRNGSTYVGYFFASVEGYSKFGSYTGNGSADGTFVYLGFRPAFIIIKQTNTTNNWIMMDNKRGNINPDLGWLYPDDPSAEDTGSSRYTDFVSNGMKIRNGGTGMNTNGGTYIYMAFAENPFKYSLGR